MKTAKIDKTTQAAYEMAVIIYRNRGTIAQMVYMLERRFPDLPVMFNIGLFPIVDAPVLPCDARAAIQAANCAIHGTVAGVGINANGDLVILI